MAASLIPHESGIQDAKLQVAGWEVRRIRLAPCCKERDGNDPHSHPDGRLSERVAGDGRLVAARRKGRAEITIVFNDHLSRFSTKLSSRLPAVRRGLRDARADPPATRSHRALAATEVDRIVPPRNAAIDVEAAAERGIVVSAYGIRCIAADHRDDLGSHPRGGASGRIEKTQICEPAAGSSRGGRQSGHGKTHSAFSASAISARRLRANRPRVRHGSDRLESESHTRKRTSGRSAPCLQRGTLPRADVLTIHLVLSERTRGMVGAAELQAMKPSARLINTSRGPIVDEPALIEVLRNRRIAGRGRRSTSSTSSPCRRTTRSGRWITSWPRHISASSPETSTGDLSFGDTVKNITRWLDQQA